MAFLFAWARLVVIQTGSIALLAFVFGDYASELWSLGAHSSSVYAAGAVAGLTALNAVGVRLGKTTQRLLTLGTVLGLLVVVAAGLFFAPASTAEVAPSGSGSMSSSQFGMAMVFVLLTYGGWNESAYVSAELHDVQRNMVRALLVSLGLITTLYLLVNWAYLNGLGLGGMSGTDAVAAALMRATLGETGAVLLSVFVAVAALSSTNATIFTGARTSFALGQDASLFSVLGIWDEDGDTPANALWVQGAIALVLVGVGAATRQGFESMVDYTAPVFWLFFLATGVALFVLRRTEPEVARPFEVPLYPVTPLAFCLASAYMLWSSLAYTGVGALLGAGVLLAGVPLLWLRR
jgi:amino acid transporter